MGNKNNYSVPFKEGEKLRYEVNWKPLFLTPAFKAGELTFSIRQSQYKKHPTYTISAQAFSDGLLSSIAGLKHELIPNARWFHEFDSDPRGYFGPDGGVEYVINSFGARDHEYS